MVLETVSAAGNGISRRRSEEAVIVIVDERRRWSKLSHEGGSPVPRCIIPMRLHGPLPSMVCTLNQTKARQAE